MTTNLTSTLDLGTLVQSPVGVLGLGKSGLATVASLTRAGVSVHAWDDKREACDAAVGLGAVAGSDVAGLKALVLSPGIPRSHPKPHPVVLDALNHGVPIINDVDLFCRGRSDTPMTAITGTNGKSTTTALTAHLFNAGGIPAVAGGNIGTPVLDLAPRPGQWAILELSSYQLETVSSGAFTTGIFLNITPDHLDRYQGMEAYVAAKARMFENQPDGAAALIGVDDEYSRSVYAKLVEEGRLRCIALTVDEPVVGGEYLRVTADGRLIDGLRYGSGDEVADLTRAQTLVGRHNWQNALAAYGAARLAGMKPEVAAKGLFTFPGLAHRQQLVAEIDGVRFVNDSKATNPDAALTALDAYDRIYWIAGNTLKPGSLDALRPGLENVAEAFLIGDGARRLSDFLRGTGVPFQLCGTLDQAVERAERAARKDRAARPTVLLSPAGASFDQFANFEARGDAFIKLVEQRYRRAEAGALTQPKRVMGVC